MTATNIVWSPHARQRAEQRGPTTLKSIHERIRNAFAAHTWEERWEVDVREGRGLRLNYLVRCGDCWALLRLAGDSRTFIICSILTLYQRDFNETHLWHRSAEDARAAADAPKTHASAPVTHNPFAAALLRRSA